MNDKTLQLTRMWMSAQPIVASFVSASVSDYSSRDDIMQEIITAVVQSFEKYDSERPFLGWVLGIARNQIGIYRRRIHRDRLMFDESAFENVFVAFSQIPATEVGKLEFLQGCLEKLTERDRLICDLRYQKEMKPAGIATATGLNPNNVSKVLQRVREQLRKCIEYQSSLSEAVK